MLDLFSSFDDDDSLFTEKNRNTVLIIQIILTLIGFILQIGF